MESEDSHVAKYVLVLIDPLAHFGFWHARSDGRYYSSPLSLGSGALTRINWIESTVCYS